VVPNQQTSLSSYFELFHLLAEGRLGYVETNRGAANVAFFDYHGEVLEMTVFDWVRHSGSPSQIAPCAIRRAAHLAMQVRPEVNLIVGACTNEVNAVQFDYNAI
jgi:hypothetical protein